MCKFVFASFIIATYLLHIQIINCIFYWKTKCCRRSAKLYSSHSLLIALRVLHKSAYSRKIIRLSIYCLNYSITRSSFGVIKRLASIPVFASIVVCNTAISPLMSRRGNFRLAKYLGQRKRRGKTMCRSDARNAL